MTLSIGELETEQRTRQCRLVLEAGNTAVMHGILGGIQYYPPKSGSVPQTGFRRICGHEFSWALANRACASRMCPHSSPRDGGNAAKSHSHRHGSLRSPTHALRIFPEAYRVCVQEKWLSGGSDVVRGYDIIAGPLCAAVCLKAYVKHKPQEECRQQYAIHPEGRNKQWCPPPGLAMNKYCHRLGGFRVEFT